MTAPNPLAPDVTGDPPDLAGMTCDALVCEAFVADGKLISAANVIYIQANGAWHRLTLSSGVIGWAQQSETPQPWAVAESGWSYPHLDLAASAGLTGHRFLSYTMSSDTSGCRVELAISNGRRAVFEEAADVVTYAVI